MSGEPFAFQVESMTLQDIEEVMTIERESFPLPWSANTYWHELRSNQHAHYSVVRQSAPVLRTSRSLWERWLKRARPRRGPVVAYGGFWLILDEAHISTIAVMPAWRGHGLGELLLASMIEQGLGLGAQIVTLEVRISNTTAQNLYYKYGFVVTGRRKRYYRDNGEDAFIMTIENAASSDYTQQFQSLRAALSERLRGRPSGQKARL